MNLWEIYNERIEQVCRGIPAGPAGWQPERLIYRDWWQWRDQEIAFAHGRLAFTGQNAGGKSSLLALAVPILLDGDTSPIRLDPALSRDRYLHWYLLGDDDADSTQTEAFQYEARIGYLALELRNAESGRYLTIGMGVDAARSHPRRIREWWGFILPDLRLGRDFDVRNAQGNCLGHRDFRALLKPPALVTTERGEYRRQVNHHLFGMTDDDYQALISMLLQARRPKLGEQSGPEKVCVLLRDSLPGIAGDHLERVAEVVDNIEQYQRNLADVSRRAAAVDEADKLLYRRAEGLQEEAARQYREAQGLYGSIVGRLTRARTSLTEAVARLKKLEAADRERARRLNEIEAGLGVFSQRDEADLPSRLAKAKRSREDKSRQSILFVDRADEQEQLILQAQQRVTDRRARFDLKRRQAAQALERLAGMAGSVGWNAGEQELRRSARDFDTLKVEDGAGEVEAVRPRPGLHSEAGDLAVAYRAAGDRWESRAEAESNLKGWQSRLADLRGQRGRCLDVERVAEDLVEERRDGLLMSLDEWRNASPALDVPDSLLSVVAEQIRTLTEAPAGGSAVCTEGLTLRGRERRAQLAAERSQLERRVVEAELRAKAIANQLDGLRRDGLTPARSPVRAAARAQHDPRNRGPLFRWVRFRPNVPQEVADRVEAAALEAGLLDLLLFPGQEAGAAGNDRAAGDGPVADAWLVPSPLPDGPTLLEVLVPEEGSPGHVSQVLRSVGWGSGNGDHWIDVDGNWRNGIAQGQVRPWLSEAPGLIGEERRAAALAARVASLEAERDLAERDRATVCGRLDQVGQLVKGIDDELTALSGLPWQPLFHALTELGAGRRQTQEAEQRVTSALPELADAEARYREADTALSGALQQLPGAGQLNGQGLGERATTLDRLAHDLEAHSSQASDLAQVMRDYQGDMAQADREGQILAERQAALAAVRQDVTSLDAEVAALEQRLADPDVAALQRQIEALLREREELRRQGAEDQRELVDVQATIKASSQQVAERTPEEERQRKITADLLDDLKRRLRFHPGLAEFAAAIEAEGPVKVLPRLPRTIGEAGPQAENSQRQGDLQAYMIRAGDLLADYRPVPSPAWETVAFHEERRELSATELFHHLEEKRQEYSGLIAEKEQELYQRIIYQGILDELRRLIKRAREFTRQTNGKLEQLTLSSGERLSLRLRPLEDVPGAGIGRALESMDQGTDWLNEERRETLLGLIRAEVEMVRTEARARNEAISYNDAIQLALDYRRWYEFQLMSRMPGSANPVIIRSRGFGRRSTSAKAWALAVPVIAGVAARYDASPRNDSPRIIALDEAFAGFDPNNQDMYLRFLNQLSLSWLITCPDELPYSASLSAAMAYRMTLEGSVHTAYPILWDGSRVSEPLSAEWEAAVADERG